MADKRGNGTWRVLIYNRASADKAGQRVSVESQDTENRAWCAREGWDVAAAVSDSNRSASRYAKRTREGYQQVLDGLGDGRWGRIDALVLWESSRGERGLDGHLQLRRLCERLGVKLAYKGRILDMNDGDDRFTAGLDALLDEREAERARERTKRSHQASVRAGKPRGLVPYGYRREYAPGSGHMLEQVPDPVTAPIVRGIVDDLLAGSTLYAIAQRLNAAGIEPPRVEHHRRTGRPPAEGAGWTSSIIRNLLRRPALMGVRTHNGLATGDGAWEPIIPAGLWREVQQLLADPARVRYHGGLEVKWLLSGIARCGPCGAWLRPMRHGSRMTYACAGLTPTAAKGHVHRAQEPLDAYIEVAVISRLSRPDALAVFSPPQVSDRRAGALGRELADAKAQLVEYEASAGTAGGVSASAFARIEARLTQRIGELEQQLAPPVQLPAVVRQVAVPDAAARWERLDMPGKRLVVRTLLEVTVLPVVKRGRRGFDPALVRLVWRGA